MPRRRFKQTQSLEERLSEEAKRLGEEAKLLPPGALREGLLRKARQAEAGRWAGISASMRTMFQHPAVSDITGFAARVRRLALQTDPELPRSPLICQGSRDVRRRTPWWRWGARSPTSLRSSTG